MPFIPSNLVNETEFYTNILSGVLHENHYIFKEYITKWPDSFYDSNTLIKCIDSLKKEQKTPVVLLSKAFLCINVHDFGQALNLLIR